jgi:hypothetical protein
MVKAGEVVDHFIEQVSTHRSAGDIIIDGGNRRARSMLLCAVAACDPTQQLERHRPPHRVLEEERHPVPRNRCHWWR